MKARHILSAFALALVAASFTGCVSKKQYTDLQAAHKQLSQDYTTLQSNYSQAQGNAQTLQALLDEARRNNTELKENYARLQGSLDKSISQNTQGNVNISKLVDQINASNKYIKQLVEAKSKSDSLNLALTTNLTRSLTSSEADEVNVKVLKGVVYISLADNMLFKSGSYEINSRAMQTLSKIAKIIKDYGDYDVLVEGNTDNVPISRENIRNNWDLSTLRASSVVQVLQNEFGVNPARLTAGGRGEYNPLADNDSELGRQRNRRTEIIITPKLDQFLELIDKAPEESAK
ncbi:MAG: OmpA family protein [Muribaculaceae bacterium]|nr:OmpA family protein [Muribaculaceae bacterium]